MLCAYIKLKRNSRFQTDLIVYKTSSYFFYSETLSQVWILFTCGLFSHEVIKKNSHKNWVFFMGYVPGMRCVDFNIDFVSRLTYSLKNKFLVKREILSYLNQ